MMHVKKQGPAWSRYNGSVLVHVVLLSVFSFVAFGGAWFANRGNAEAGLTAVLGCLAISTPFALLREFARRVEFAHLRLTHSVVVDGAVAALQLSLLGYFAWSNQLTAGMAVMTIGVSSAAAGLVWLWSVRRTFHPDWREVWTDLASGWRLGRWMFMAQLTGLIHLQGMIWLIAFWLNPALTGLFAACTTLVQFINPFALGLNNFISPMTVRTVADRGLQPARRLVGTAMGLLFLCVLGFTLTMALTSDTMLGFILPKAMPAGQGGLVFILGLNLAFNAAHMVNDGGLWAVERPQIIFYSSVIAVVVSGIASILLIPTWALWGAAVALLIGRIAAASFEAFVFFIVLRPEDVPNYRGGDSA
ncbi:MAG: hypothetical protein KDA92_10310 [Planctomycetales bacterium]|nr:hypothetical protein [Planctomycetales bacterium]